MESAQAQVDARKTLYLANPYGFSRQQRSGPLLDLVAALEQIGAEVWEPFARNNDPETLEAADWAYRICQADMRDVRDADGLFAVVNGCPPDEGVMVELGMAIAWGKPIFLFRDDFRRYTDGADGFPLNAMLFSAFAKDAWERHWYTDLQQIFDPDKALVPWLAGRLIERP